jgi:chromosome segregation ATPase
LQIEKENDTLKAKVEQMREKMSSLAAQSQMEQETEIKINVLATSDNASAKETLENEGTNDGDDDDDDEDKPLDEKKQEALNKISLKHIDEELTSVNQSIHLFIEEKKELQKQSEENKKEEEDKELEQKNERIRELELEKEALNKKLVSIEASLARWIFRACDYKSDVSKLNEKWSSSEQVINDLSRDLAEANKRVAVTQDKLNELTQSLDIQVRQVSELSVLNKDLEVRVKLLQVVPKEFTEAQTQTSVEAQHGRLVGAKTSGLVAQTAAKLHQLINSTGLEKEELRKDESTTLAVVKTAQSTSSSSLETAAGCTNKRIESLTSEISQLKTKLDALILERNSYKCKNDELTSDLNSLRQTLKSATASAVVVSPQLVATKSTNTNSKLEARSTQTHSNSHTSSTQTCTQISELTTSSSSTSNLVNTNNAKIDQLKKDLDCMRLKLTKEQNDLNAQIDEKNTELKRLEDTIKHLLKQIEDLHTRLNESVANKDTLQKSHDEQVAKLNSNFKIEKQISDTIIQQQKKLLYYLQMKLNGDTPVESTCEKSNDHHHNHGIGNNNHSSNKKFKFKHSKPSHNSNPLLANLHKTTNQQIINNKVTNSKEAVIVNKKLNDITTELNTNYEVYSSMSAKNQMELNKFDKKYSNLCYSIK